MDLLDVMRAGSPRMEVLSSKAYPWRGGRPRGWRHRGRGTRRCHSPSTEGWGHAGGGAARLADTPGTRFRGARDVSVSAPAPGWYATPVNADSHPRISARSAVGIGLPMLLFACDAPPVGRDEEVSACVVGDGLPRGEPLRGAVAVEAAGRRACALMGSGRVECWGVWDEIRSFPPDEPAARPITLAREVQGVSDGRALSVGSSGACAVVAGGRAVCWATREHRLDPLRAVQGASDVVDVAGDDLRGCVLDLRGDVRCWGMDRNVFIGRGEIAAEAVPGGVGVLALAKEVPGAFLRRDGEVYAFDVSTLAISRRGRLPGAVGLSAGIALCGWDADGRVQCLDADAPTVDATHGLRRGLDACGLGADRRLRCTRSRAAALWDLDELGPVEAFALESEFGCAVLEGAGEVVCWGKADEGQLGDRAVPYAFEPVQSNCTPPLDDVAAGTTSTCVLDAHGVVACAGAEDPVLRPTPALGAPRQLTAWGDHFCGLDADARLRCIERRWDRAGWVFAPGGLDERAEDTVQFSPGAQRAVRGGTLTCALRADARVECAWREGEAAGFGPVGLVAGVEGAVSVAAGYAFACARLATGRVRCWGANTNGELGSGCAAGASALFGCRRIEAEGEPTDARRASVEVPGIEGAVDLALGSATACVVGSDGDVMCWGHECYRPHDYSDRGSRGNIITPTPAPISGVAALAAGPSCRFCATRADGSVACFGEGYATAPFRADNPAYPHPALQPVPRLTDPRALSVGYLHTCALTTSGGLSCWGFGAQGQLADAQPRFRRAPAPVLHAATP